MATPLILRALNWRKKMAKFIKLKDTNNYGKPIFVNVDRIINFRESSKNEGFLITILSTDYGQFDVSEKTEEILKLIEAAN